MVFHINSDASYIPVRDAHSWFGGNLFLSQLLPVPIKAPTTVAITNRLLHDIRSILRCITASAADA